MNVARRVAFFFLCCKRVQVKWGELGWSGQDVLDRFEVLKIDERHIRSTLVENFEFRSVKEDMMDMDESTQR